MNTKSNQKSKRSVFPVIKIGYDQKIIYSNLAGLPILQDWDCSLNSKLPEYILARYTALKNCFINRATDEMLVPFRDFIIRFKINAQPVEGYIELTGYKIDTAVPVRDFKFILN